GGSGQGPGTGREAPTAAPPREAAAASVTGTMRATAEVGTRVTVDGRGAYEGTRVDGARRSFPARRALDLHLGNVGGVQLTVDGRSRGAPGRSGQVWRGRCGPEGGGDGVCAGRWPRG